MTPHILYYIAAAWSAYNTVACIAVRAPICSAANAAITGLLLYTAYTL